MESEQKARRKRVETQTRRRRAQVAKEKARLYRMAVSLGVPQPERRPR